MIKKILKDNGKNEGFFSKDEGEIVYKSNQKKRIKEK